MLFVCKSAKMIILFLIIRGNLLFLLKCHWARIRSWCHDIIVQCSDHAVIIQGPFFLKVTSYSKFRSYRSYFQLWLLTARAKKECVNKNWHYAWKYKKIWRKKSKTTQNHILNSRLIDYFAPFAPWFYCNELT